MKRFDQSKKRLANFAKYLPGGVNSNFRMGISPTPLVFERAEGPYLYDVDGNRLIDYYLGMGPMILGHNPEPVLKAVTEQLKYGILYAGQSEIEFEAARLFCEIVPCAELVRFNCAGSEVVQAALRVARAATRRSIIVKFEGALPRLARQCTLEHRPYTGSVRTRNLADTNSCECRTGPTRRSAYRSASLE